MCIVSLVNPSRFETSTYFAAISQAICKFWSYVEIFVSLSHSIKGLFSICLKLSSGNPMLSNTNSFFHIAFVIHVGPDQNLSTNLISLEWMQFISEFGRMTWQITYSDQPKNSFNSNFPCALSTSILYLKQSLLFSSTSYSRGNEMIQLGRMRKSLLALNAKENVNVVLKSATIFFFLSNK